MGSSSATEMAIGMIGKVEKRDGNLNCRRAGVMVGIGGNFKNGRVRRQPVRIGRVRRRPMSVW
jgi:hypothetical protein